MKIGNNVFIGVNTTVLPNTTIEDNVIIGAGSVVKGVCEANSVYAGLPAKKISSTGAYFEKRRTLQLEEAVTLANEYIDVYRDNPPKEVFHEFFWLFENDFDNLPPQFKKQFGLKGNMQISQVAFSAHKPQFSSFEEFLAYCKARKESGSV